jgi:hypothetical protein
MLVVVLRVVLVSQLCVSCSSFLYYALLRAVQLPLSTLAEPSIICFWCVVVAMAV